MSGHAYEVVLLKNGWPVHALGLDAMPIGRVIRRATPDKIEIKNYDRTARWATPEAAGFEEYEVLPPNPPWSRYWTAVFRRECRL